MTFNEVASLAACLVLAVAGVLTWRWTKRKDAEAFAAVDAELPPSPDRYSFTGLLDDTYDIPAGETQRIPGLFEVVYGRHSKCRERRRYGPYVARHHRVEGAPLPSWLVLVGTERFTPVEATT